MRSIRCSKQGTPYSSLSKFKSVEQSYRQSPRFSTISLDQDVTGRHRMQSEDLRRQRRTQPQRNNRPSHTLSKVWISASPRCELARILNYKRLSLDPVLDNEDKTTMVLDESSNRQDFDRSKSILSMNESYSVNSYMTKLQVSCQSVKKEIF